jgi:hypothetical protein
LQNDTKVVISSSPGLPALVRLSGKQQVHNSMYLTNFKPNRVDTVWARDRGIQCF